MLTILFILLLCTFNFASTIPLQVLVTLRTILSILRLLLQFNFILLNYLNSIQKINLSFWVIKINIHGELIYIGNILKNYNYEDVNLCKGKVNRYINILVYIYIYKYVNTCK
jgi:hypothetical protein